MTYHQQSQRLIDVVRDDLAKFIALENEFSDLEVHRILERVKRKISVAKAALPHDFFQRRLAGERGPTTSE